MFKWLSAKRELIFLEFPQDNCILFILDLIKYLTFLCEHFTYYVLQNYLNFWNFYILLILISFSFLFYIIRYYRVLKYIWEIEKNLKYARA